MRNDLNTPLDTETPFDTPALTPEQDLAARLEIHTTLKTLGLPHLVEPVGSAQLPNYPAKDVDYLVLVSFRNFAPLEKHLLENHYIHCGDYDPNTSGPNWLAMRKGPANIIFTCDPSFYYKFLAATQVIYYLNLTNKVDRIGVCNIIRDGMSAQMAKEVAKEFTQ